MYKNKDRIDPWILFFYDGKPFWQSSWIFWILYPIFTELSKKSSFDSYKGDVYVTKEFCEKLEHIFKNFWFFSAEGTDRLISNQDYFDKLNKSQQSKKSLIKSDEKETAKVLRYLFCYRDIYGERAEEPLEEEKNMIYSRYKIKQETFSYALRDFIETKKFFNSQIRPEELFSQVTNWIAQNIRIRLQNSYLSEFSEKNKKSVLEKIQQIVFLKMFSKTFPRLHPVRLSGAVILIYKQKFSYFTQNVAGLNHLFLNSFFQIYLKDVMNLFKEKWLSSENKGFSWSDLSPDFLQKMKKTFGQINFFVGEEDGNQVIFEISTDKTSVKKIEDREKEKEILKTLEDKRSKLFEKIIFRKDIFALMVSNSEEISKFIESE